ncbi:ATP-binding cassette sub-family A member 2-like [Saccoglossus kowalevskii]
MDEVTKDAEDDCVDSVSFWRHLQLLLWKNYTQKKRSPITVLFELFIPLIIFIVLSVVRSTQQEVPRPSEYGQGVALPSAGLIPVLQYFCPPVSSDPYGIPDYSNSKVPQLLEFIHYISNSNDSLLDAKNVESVITEIRENMKAIDTQHMSDHLSSDPSILKQMLTDPDTKIDITSNPAMQKVLSNAHYLQTLEEQLDWIKPISEHLDIFITDSNVCNSQNTAFKSPLNHTVTKQMFIEQSIRQPTKPVELLFKAWNVFQMVLCGVNVTENNYEEYQGNWSNINTKLSENLFSHLQPLSSILLGKARIAYAPNTTDVNDVIKMTSSYFHSFKRLSVLADKWLNISRPVVDFMEENSTQDLYRLLQQVQTILQNTSGVNFTRDEQLIISTSLPDLDKIRHIMELLDTVACFVNSLSSHLDVDVFHPLSNEQSFLNYTNDVRGQSSRMVIAGLVFDVDDSGKLPSHVKYKLKMNTTNFSRSSETFKIEEKTWTQLHVHPVMMFGLDLNDTTLGDLPKLIIDRMELNLTQDGPLGKIIVRTLKLLDYLNSKLGLMIFPWLQDLVDRAIIEKKVGHNITEPGNYIQEFPYPCHVNDPFLHKMGRFTNMMLLLGWLYYVVLVTQSIVYEKEQKLKEMMKIAGLNNLVHWVAWFITGFVEMTVSTTLLVFILKYGRVFAYTDAFLFWLYNMLYAVCTLLFCFVVSVFFSKAKLGAACAGIIYLLCNIPFWFIQDQENSAFKTVSRLQKIISCLASPSAYGLGLRYAHFYERQAIGLQWSNVNEPWPPFNEDLTMADVMLIMFCDCIMYIILIWYIEAVFPGNYGVPKAWYFPVQKPYHYIKSLCTCRTSKNSYNLPRNLRSADFCQGEGNAGRKVLLEGEPLGCKLGIHIDNIVKVYKQGKVRAVNNLNLNLYEGQITALLGHNGAGKTTIMSILTGFIPPTSGVATVNGYDIIEDMANIRQNLGVCLQYNALFDKLTVEEHLWFFSQLKGYSLTQLRITMHRLLTDTGLMHKRHSTVTQLSGGMKRKLSVAIAFTGGSKTVILDEPTAGVDPYARRAIWDLLLKNKQDCTILLSTHHMDEASLLGDRIAIISSGQLQCCGSPHYLKQMYGDGYKLIVTKKGFNELNGASSEDPLSSRLPSTPSSPSLSASFSASTMVTSFIRKHIPSATLHSEKNNVLVYTMPKENTKKSQFIDLFEGLSRNQLSLEISSYEVTESTLEQIFLKVTQGIKADKVESRQKSHGIHLTLTRVVGQLLKRLHYMKRDIKILVSQLLMPVVFLLLAIWGAISISVDPGKAFSMELNSEIFKADTFYVPYTDQSWTCLRNNDQCPDSQEILDTQKLIRTLLFKAGLGASYTVLSNDNNTTLDLFNQSSSIWVGNLTEKLDLVVNYSLSINHNRDNVSEAIEGYALPVEYLYGTPYTEYDMDCECREDNTGLDCPESIAKPDVAQVQVPSGEILLDISGRNFTQYLINTYREFHLNRQVL